MKTFFLGILFSVFAMGQQIPVTTSQQKTLQNVISNAGFENGRTGWVTYSDTGSRPVDGVGGSSSITITASQTAPLSGKSSGILSKDAANRQGQGISYAFSIDPVDKARVLKIEFDYIVDSGTFVAGTSSTDSDVIVYIYDVTNSTLIEPSSIKLLASSTSISDRFSATFQTSHNSTNYRLILHCSSTSTSAYSLKLDGVSVSPSQYVYGTPITDWREYIPNIVGMGTVSNNTARWRRVGGDIEVLGSFTAGTSTAVPFSISLPNNHQIDTSKLSSTTRTGSGWLMRGISSTTTTFPSVNAGPYRMVIATDTSNSLMYASLQTNSTALPYAVATGTQLGSSADVFDYNFSFPAMGQQSSVQVSDSADTRVVAFIANNPSIASHSSETIIPWASVSDTHAAFNGTIYTAPVSGYYQVEAGLLTNSFASSITGAIQLGYKINGGTIVRFAWTTNNGANTNFWVGGSTLIFLNQGQTVGIYSTSTSSITYAQGTLGIKRISGPSAISASESIVVSANNSSSQTLLNNTEATVINWTETTDSHGSFNPVTGIFTAPIGGKYEVSAIITISDTTSAGDRDVSIRKNSVTIFSNLRPYTAAGSGLWTQNISGVLSLVAGDTIDIRALQSSGASLSLAAGPTRNILSIKRIGN